MYSDTDSEDDSESYDSEDSDNERKDTVAAMQNKLSKKKKDDQGRGQSQKTEDSEKGFD